MNIAAAVIKAYLKTYNNLSLELFVMIKLDLYQECKDSSRLENNVFFFCPDLSYWSSELSQRSKLYQCRLATALLFIVIKNCLRTLRNKVTYSRFRSPYMWEAQPYCPNARARQFPYQLHSFASCYKEKS